MKPNRALRISFLLIFITTFFIYTGTFSYSFHFDDSHVIAGNTMLDDLANFWPPYGTRYFGYLSFALNKHFSGLNVGAYHLTNTLVHAANGILVCLLAMLTFSTPALRRFNVSSGVRFFLPLTTALIFVSHPLQTGAVTYISQRFTSLAVLFYLLSLVLYIGSRLCTEAPESTKPSGRGITVMYVFSLLFAVCAMMTKEISFTLPFMIVLYEFLFFRAGVEARGTGALKRFPRLIPFALTLFIIPLHVLGSVSSEGGMNALDAATRETSSIGRWSYLFTQFRVIITYIRLLFWPARQNLDYDYPVYESFSAPPVLLSFLFLLCLLGLAFYLLRRSRQSNAPYALLSCFGIFWFFIALSVESSIIPIRDVIFEHRMYLPGIGAVIAAVGGVYQVFHSMNVKRFSRAAIFLLLLTVLPLSVASIKRSQVWKDGLTLWTDVVRKSPDKVRGHFNLGLYYIDEERFAVSVDEFNRALEIDPEYDKAYYGLGLVYEKEGKLDLAKKSFEKALSIKPDNKKAREALLSLSVT